MLIPQKSGHGYTIHTVSTRQEEEARKRYQSAILATRPKPNPATPRHGKARASVAVSTPVLRPTAPVFRPMGPVSGHPTHPAAAHRPLTVAEEKDDPTAALTTIGDPSGAGPSWPTAPPAMTLAPRPAHTVSHVISGDGSRTMHSTASPARPTVWSSLSGYVPRETVAAGYGRFAGRRSTAVARERLSRAAAGEVYSPVASDPFRGVPVGKHLFAKQASRLMQRRGRKKIDDLSQIECGLSSTTTI